MRFTIRRSSARVASVRIAISRVVAVSALTLCAIAALPLSGHAQAKPGNALSPDDLLAMRTVTPGDFSPDGKWLVVRIGKRSDGLNYDASREGDPSYTRPAGARVYVLDAATGDTTVVMPVPHTIGSVLWSDNGSRLAITTRDSVPALYIWDLATKKLRNVVMPGIRVSDNSELKWTTDDRLVFSIRERGWLAQVQARFDTLVRGPITVQVGGDPFLAWDGLRRLGGRSLVVALNATTSKLDTLLSATQMNAYTVTADGKSITWREDANIKTNYEGGATNESKFMARINGGAPHAIFPSMRGINISLADNGERYAYAKDGAIYAASISDTATRRVIGPAPRAGSDSARGGGGGGGRGGAGNAADSSARSREERYTLVRISPVGDAVVASTRLGMWLVDLNSGARRALSTVTDTISGPRITVTEWTDDGRTLYLSKVSRTSWDRSIVRVNAATGAADTLVHDARLYGAPRLSKDGTRMALTISANGMPADLWMAGARFETPKRVIASNPQLASRAMPHTQLVKYLDADGKSQFGVLTLPPGEGKNLPTVFSIYEDFFDDTFDATTIYLASHGYAVMKPSVSFDIGYPGEAWVKGVTASANKLIEMGITDSAKLGVHGTSYGGYATNLLITQTSRFKAAINVSGKVDMISFYTDSPRLGVRNINAAEKTQDRIGATMWEQPQKYVQHSAVMFADRIKTPLLLMTGGEDTNVPALNTREMYYALRRLNKTVEWVNYAHGGHGIPMTNANEFGDWHTRLLGWYDKYLMPTGKPKAAATTQGN
ncbi:MAG: prolyl oligopeptidase family serine peptidase [Gemmatimonadaceae bacterium]